MTLPFLLISILLVAFSVLALLDGIYLHLIRFKLYRLPEAKFEHFTHSIRAILFPAILYFLMLQQHKPVYYYIGCIAVAIDLLVLGIDAYVEKDSRKAMGGLPRWEYIIHLFVNGFHFAALAVFFSLKLSYSIELGLQLENLRALNDFATFSQLLVLLLPGAIGIAVAHVLVMVPAVQNFLQGRLSNIRCC